MSQNLNNRNHKQYFTKKLQLHIGAVLFVFLLAAIACSSGPAATGGNQPADVDNGSDMTPTIPEEMATLAPQKSYLDETDPVVKLANNSKFFFSKTTKELRTLILREVLADYDSSCEIEIGTVQVTQKADENGVWIESWAMTICGEEHSLTVKVTPDGAGGYTFEITEPE